MNFLAINYRKINISAFYFKALFYAEPKYFRTLNSLYINSSINSVTRDCFFMTLWSYFQTVKTFGKFNIIAFTLTTPYYRALHNQTTKIIVYLIDIFRLRYLIIILSTQRMEANNHVYKCISTQTRPLP